jgi:hypothetical protein
MKEIDLSFRTMFAELAQRSLDAAFQADFPLTGRFVPANIKGKRYWYFDLPAESGTARKYVGPDDDPDIADRVARFKQLKNDYRARRKLVAVLIREAGLPAPDRVAGEIIATLAEAGLFRLRAVLVGTVAFLCYPGVLGVRFPAAPMMTGDVDFAQFHSISTALEDTLPPILEVLRKVDPTYREIPHSGDSRSSTKFENARRFNIEFLTPNTGSDDYEDLPAPMASLGGASAQPLRFLDFLIHEPIRSVMLYGGGVPVTIPAPERYAVHKLIVASRRRHDAFMFGKREKDLNQAHILAEALAQTRSHADVASAFVEAWRGGDAWSEAITRGLSYMRPEGRTIFTETVRRGLSVIGESPDNFGLAE